MHNTVSFITGYMDNAVFDLVDTVDKAVAQLTPHADEFDTIVGTGFSGGMVIPMIATMLNKHFVLIRKETDDSHHGSGRLLGELGERWIFVDDFVQSGRTKNRVIEKVAEAARSELHVTTYVGNYYYEGWNKNSWNRNEPPEKGTLELLPKAEWIEMGNEEPEPVPNMTDEFRLFEEGPLSPPSFYRSFGEEYRRAREEFVLAADEVLVKIGDGFVQPKWQTTLEEGLQNCAPVENNMLVPQEFDGETVVSIDPIAEVLHLKKSKKPAFERFTKRDFRKRA